MRKALSILVVTFLAAGCESCLSKIYRVHEKQTPISIVFEQKFTPSVLDNYIDSLNRDREKINSYCTPTSISIEQSDKILCFPKEPCECYLIAIKGESVAIQAIYVPHLNQDFWLTKREQVNDSVLHRVEQRFRKEILEKL